MSDSADTTAHEGAGTTDPSVDRSPVRLRATVVEYDGKPDRCTIYPGDATGVERMSTWLSADADVFVPLSAAGEAAGWTVRCRTAPAHRAPDLPLRIQTRPSGKVYLSTGRTPVRASTP